MLPHKPLITGQVDEPGIPRVDPYPPASLGAALPSGFSSPCLVNAQHRGGQRLGQYPSRRRQQTPDVPSATTRRQGEVTAYSFTDIETTPARRARRRRRLIGDHIDHPGPVTAALDTLNPCSWQPEQHCRSVRHSPWLLPRPECFATLRLQKAKGPQPLNTPTKINELPARSRLKSPHISKGPVSAQNLASLRPHQSYRRTHGVTTGVHLRIR